MSRFLFWLTCLLAGTVITRGEIKMETVRYADGDTALEGVLVYDDAHAGPRPGVLVVHEWWGRNDFARDEAKRLAELGYAALVVDMYGDGRTTTSPDEAGQWANAFRNDRPLTRRRLGAALDALREQPAVDGRKVAAIGYCFGGMCVLELARGGADLLGVVSFHGLLSTPEPAGAGQVRARVLVCHGADDPYVPDEQVEAFVKEMRKAGANWQLNAYGGAVHAYMNPATGDDPSDGVAFHAEAAARSWQAMKDFFARLFDGI
jgi:dienelactone hydrolase